MRLHLASIGDTRLKYLDEEYVAPTGTLSIGDIVEKKNHNTMMIDIASALSYEELMRSRTTKILLKCGTS